MVQFVLPSIIVDIIVSFQPILVHLEVLVELSHLDILHFSMHSVLPLSSMHLVRLMVHSLADLHGIMELLEQEMELSVDEMVLLVL